MNLELPPVGARKDAKTKKGSAYSSLCGASVAPGVDFPGILVCVLTRVHVCAVYSGHERPCVESDAV